jgi:hypothetical protein
MKIISPFISRSSFFIPVIFFIVTTLIFCHWLGFSILNPYRVAWLFDGDYMQNFAALNLYRYSDWHFPIGHVSGSDFPLGSNIVFLDGNMLLGIPLKLLSSFIPHTFQPYGAWIFACLYLQLLSAYWALKQMGSPTFFACLGAVPFILE